MNHQHVLRVFPLVAISLCPAPFASALAAGGAPHGGGGPLTALGWMAVMYAMAVAVSMLTAVGIKILAVMLRAPEAPRTDDKSDTENSTRDGAS